MGSERAYQFFRLVERMRDKQKEYFRTRSAAVLNESKHLERDVDKEIQRVNNVRWAYIEDLLPNTED